MINFIDGFFTEAIFYGCNDAKLSRKWQVPCRYQHSKENTHHFDCSSKIFPKRIHFGVSDKVIGNISNKFNK